jgi:hypothetical protein
LARENPIVLASNLLNLITKNTRLRTKYTHAEHNNVSGRELPPYRPQPASHPNLHIALPILFQTQHKQKTKQPFALAARENPLHAYKVFYLCKYQSEKNLLIMRIEPTTYCRKLFGSFIANGVVLPDWANLPICWRLMGFTAL